MRRTRHVASALAAAPVLLLVVSAPVRSARAQDDVPALYQKTYDQEASGQYAKALGTLASIQGAERDTYIYKLRHAWLSYLDGKYAQAAASYDAAAASEPKALEPKVGALLPLLALRRWSDVVPRARGILKSAPGNGIVRGRLAWALYNQGKYRDAAEEYALVVEAYPSDVDMRAGLGWALLKSGKGDEAAKHFRQVLHVAPKHGTAREGLLALGATK